MRFAVNPSRISHDRLQDEVIIINVGSGAYYSGAGTAADLWSIVSQGSTIDGAVSLLASAYSADERQIARDVEASMNFLLERGLIECIVAEETAEPTLPESMRDKWLSPHFDEHMDMWELIKLDPIHEVDEVGWPVAKA